MPARRAQIAAVERSSSEHGFDVGRRGEAFDRTVYLRSQARGEVRRQRKWTAGAIEDCIRCSLHGTERQREREDGGGEDGSDGAAASCDR